MEILAFANGALQVGVIVAAIAAIKAPQPRRVVITLALVPLACSVLALLVLVLPFDLADVDWWAVGRRLLYMAIAVGILFAVRLALRSTGSTRFAWRRGTYAQYTIREEYRERQ